MLTLKLVKQAEEAEEALADASQMGAVASNQPRSRMDRYRPCGHDRAYFSSEKKLEARRFIVDCWRNFSGQQDILGQYWTLCGPMTRDGVLQPGCELKQLEAAGLFRAVQFIGVEHREDVCKANLRAVKAAYRRSERPSLPYGDIVELLLRYQCAGKLSASIVNLDTPFELHAALRLLRRTLNVLNHVDGPTMVVWNVISGRRYPRSVAYPWDKHDVGTRGRVIGDYISETLQKDTLFREAYRHGWDMFPDEDGQTFKACRYDETSATQMTTYVFVRRRRACGDNCTC